MNEDKRFYGIYEGICTNNQDPTKKSMIKLKVPQVLGDSETDWAKPCLPVTDNSNHPDHIAHTAAQVAALLNMTNDGSPPHTHSIQGTTGLQLTHPHVTTVNKSNKWNASSGAYNDLTSALEHTPHRLVPDVKQKVWVMFIAGDPNFPVWMGVEL
jgi:hypothetical protein